MNLRPQYMPSKGSIPGRLPLESLSNPDFENKKHRFLDVFCGGRICRLRQFLVDHIGGLVEPGKTYYLNYKNTSRSIR
jgi:hypothetical protein